MVRSGPSPWGPEGRRGKPADLPDFAKETRAVTASAHTSLPFHPLHATSSETAASGLPIERLPDAFSLRLSLTERCNFRCLYCMPPDGIARASRQELARLEQTAALVEWLAETFPLADIKLTGGEPLVRRGIEHLIRRLANIPGRRDLSMTTNATLLDRLADPLAEAGLQRINVSLDTLDPERFRRLTRGGEVERTLAGIEAARRAGLGPIKINSVLLESTYRDDVPRLLDYAAEHDLEIRFLELMRTGTERKWIESELVSAKKVICELFDSECIDRLSASGSAPARHTRVTWRGRKMTVGWITPQFEPFCDRCNRLRLDSRGRLRRCLMDPATFDLRGEIQDGRRNDSAQRVENFLLGKRLFLPMDNASPMNQLGG